MQSSHAEAGNRGVVALFRRRESPDQPPPDVASSVPPRRAPKRERSQFTALYDQYFALICCYCFVWLGSQERAEDATHQVFGRALEAFPRYEDAGRARERLFAIAHNVVVNEATRRVAASLEAVEDLPDPEHSPKRRPSGRASSRRCGK